MWKCLRLFFNSWLNPLCEYLVTHTVLPFKLISSDNKLWIRAYCYPALHKAATVKKLDEFPCLQNICFIHRDRLHVAPNPLLPFPPNLVAQTTVCSSFTLSCEMILSEFQMLFQQLCAACSSHVHTQ